MFLYSSPCAQFKKGKMLCVCFHISLYVFLFVLSPGSPSCLTLIPGQKKLFDSCRSTHPTVCQAPTFNPFFSESLSFFLSSFQTTGQLWLSKNTSTSTLNPAPFLPLSLPPFVCLSSCIVGIWPTAPAIRKLWVYDLLSAPLCVSLDGHLGSWPSSWILSLLLNSDSPFLSLSQLCPHRQQHVQWHTDEHTSEKNRREGVREGNRNERLS